MKNPLPSLENPKSSPSLSPCTIWLPRTNLRVAKALPLLFSSLLRWSTICVAHIHGMSHQKFPVLERNVSNLECVFFPNCLGKIWRWSILLISGAFCPRSQKELVPYNSKPRHIIYPRGRTVLMPWKPLRLPWKPKLSWGGFRKIVWFSCEIYIQIQIKPLYGRCLESHWSCLKVSLIMWTSARV